MKSFTALVALLSVSVALLSGCATVGLNPDHPLAVQPEVPEGVRAQLVGKSLKDFRIYVGNIVYYDVTPLLRRDDNGKNQWKVKSFTKEFPVTSRPPTETVVAAFQFLKAFRARLRESGYAVADEPCGSLCLRLDIDFATVVLRPNGLNPVTVILERTRVFYKGVLVLRTADDLMGGAKQGVFFSSREKAREVANQISAVGFTEELERSWRMVFQVGQKVSTAAGGPEFASTR
ncbi:MAG: hypothetical protein B7X03_01650 [Parcubacteria group bacterium 21-58-10]|nr:MAG: hypothetical protein B7X03_01650 [Parcubacteria group bacterium 21-58-10]